jgi:hypothetical protein
MPTEYRQGDGHVYRLIAGEHLLVALGRDVGSPLFALTPTGAVVWTALEEWSTMDRLVERIVTHFETTADVARADIDEFLAQLRTIDAVRSRESGT